MVASPECVLRLEAHRAFDNVYRRCRSRHWQPHAPIAGGAECCKDSSLEDITLDPSSSFSLETFVLDCKRIQATPKNRSVACTPVVRKALIPTKRSRLGKPVRVGMVLLIETYSCSLLGASNGVSLWDCQSFRCANFSSFWRSFWRTSLRSRTVLWFTNYVIWWLSTLFSSFADRKKASGMREALCG